MFSTGIVRRNFVASLSEKLLHLRIYEAIFPYEAITELDRLFEMPVVSSENLTNIKTDLGA